MVICYDSEYASNQAQGFHRAHKNVLLSAKAKELLQQARRRRQASAATLPCALRPPPTPRPDVLRALALRLALRLAVRAQGLHARAAQLSQPAAALVALRESVQQTREGEQALPGEG